MFARIALAGFLTVGLLGFASAQEKKDEPRKGTVTGVVTAKPTKKGEVWIEIKADGEVKGRKYVPQWKGGAPAQGGGFDKDIVARIKETPVNSRVRIEWFFEERPRVMKLEILKKPGTKAPEKQ